MFRRVSTMVLINEDGVSPSQALKCGLFLTHTTVQDCKWSFDDAINAYQTELIVPWNDYSSTESQSFIRHLEIPITIIDKSLNINKDQK